jgi:hypothetical protein
MIHRSFLNQLADYQFVAETLRRRLKGVRPHKAKAALDDTVKYSVRCLLRRAGQIPYFHLHKLYYLIEYANFRATGRRLSRAYIIRQKDGPYVTDLNVASLRRSMPDLDILRERGELIFRLRHAEADMFSSDASAGKADANIDALIDQVWERYGSATNEQLKTAVYLTSPMRSLLRAEKYSKLSTFNRPVEFGH